MGGGGHSDDEGTPYDQRLEEMEFMRGACAAAQRGDVEKLRALLSRRPELAHADGAGGDSGYTPLHYAAREGHAECVSLLLSRGAAVDAATSAGAATPLHRAAYTNRADVVRILLAAGADPAAADADAETPLHKASARGAVACVEILRRAAPHVARLVDRRGARPEDRAPTEDARAPFRAAAAAKAAKANAGEAGRRLRGDGTARLARAE